MDGINWIVVEAIGVCAGAVATFLAILFSLDQSRKATIAKAKVNAEFRVFPYSSYKKGEKLVESVNCEKSLVITITNIGIINLSIKAVVVCKSKYGTRASQTMNDFFYPQCDVRNVVAGYSEILNLNLKQITPANNISNGIRILEASRLDKVREKLLAKRKYYRVFIVEDSGRWHKAKMKKETKRQLKDDYDQNILDNKTMGDVSLEHE